MCEKPIRGFSFVPDGSTLEVWTQGESGAFTTVAKLRSTAGDDRRWLHDDLFRPDGDTSTKKTQALQGPHFYRVRFTTAFNSEGDTTAEIHTRVMVDGEEKPVRQHTWKLKGKRPQNCVNVLRIGTEDTGEDID